MDDKAEPVVHEVEAHLSVSSGMTATRRLSEIDIMHAFYRVTDNPMFAIDAFLTCHRAGETPPQWVLAGLAKYHRKTLAAPGRDQQQYRTLGRHRAELVALLEFLTEHPECDITKALKGEYDDLPMMANIEAVYYGDDDLPMREIRDFVADNCGLKLPEP